MGTLRWMTGSLVGIGLMIGPVATAQAQSRWDHGWDHHRRHDNGFGFGDAVGVAALVGAVAIVATSLSKDKAARDGNREPNASPPANGTDYGADVAPVSTAQGDDHVDRRATGGASADQMSDDCADAARQEAQGQNGGYAEVRQMDDPRTTSDGYNIDGQVESRATYGATDGTTRRFTCTVRDGRVAQVYLSRDVVMR